MTNLPPQDREWLLEHGHKDIVDREGDYSQYEAEIQQLIHANDEKSGNQPIQQQPVQKTEQSRKEDKAQQRIAEVADEFYDPEYHFETDDAKTGNMHIVIDSGKHKDERYDNLQDFKESNKNPTIVPDFDLDEMERQYYIEKEKKNKSFVSEDEQFARKNKEFNEKAKKAGIELGGTYNGMKVTGFDPQTNTVTLNNSTNLSLDEIIEGKSERDQDIANDIGNQRNFVTLINEYEKKSSNISDNKSDYSGKSISELDDIGFDGKHNYIINDLRNSRYDSIEEAMKALDKFDDITPEQRDYVEAYAKAVFGELDGEDNKQTNQIKSKYPHKDFGNLRYYPTESRMEGNRWVGNYHSIHDAFGLNDFYRGENKQEPYKGTSIIQLPDGYFSINPNITSMSFKTRKDLEDYLDHEYDDDYRNYDFKDDIQVMRKRKDGQDEEPVDAYIRAKTKQSEQADRESVAKAMRESLKIPGDEVESILKGMSKESYEKLLKWIKTPRD